MPSREDLRMDRHVLNVRPRDVLPNKMFFKLPSIHLTVTFILTVTFFLQKAYIYYTLSNLQAAEFLVWDWVILPSAYITYIWISSLPNYQWHIPCPSIPQFLPPLTILQTLLPLWSGNYPINSKLLLFGKNLLHKCMDPHTTKIN